MGSSATVICSASSHDAVHIARVAYDRSLTGTRVRQRASDGGLVANVRDLATAKELPYGHGARSTLPPPHGR